MVASRMLSRRKAVFFTFVAIILLSSLVFSFSIYSRYRMREKGVVIETRVNTMNSFMKDLDKDIKRGLFISSHRSILSLVEHVSSTGEFVDDTGQRFSEAFINGTIEGLPQSLMSDTTFPDWESKMQAEGAKINLELDFNVKNITISQSSPWAVDVYLGIQIYAEDSTRIAAWNVTRTIMESVPINGFEDPVYAVNTGAKVLNAINKTPFTDFVSGADTSHLQAHTSNSYYTEWQGAPSFLMRLEGDMSPSDYGIESLVNLQELIDQGISVQERSVVDYIYWSNQTVSSHRISNMPSWFRMDDEESPAGNMTHLELYEVEGLVI